MKYLFNPASEYGESNNIGSATAITQIQVSSILPITISMLFFIAGLLLLVTAIFIYIMKQKVEGKSK